MHIMSKSGHLSERPKPPTLEEIECDLLNTKDTEIVLSVGEKYLQKMDYASIVFQSQELDSQPSLNTSNTSVDSSTDISQSQIKESNEKVQRLLELYSNLKGAPSELEQKLSRLKTEEANMAESISQLNSLSQSVGLTEETDKGSETAKSTRQEKAATSKEKAKSKRKK